MGKSKQEINTAVILQRIRSGESLKSISETSGISYSRLYRRFKDELQDNKKLDDDVMKEAKVRLCKGESLRSIANSMQVSYKKLSKELRDLASELKQGMENGNMYLEKDIEVYGEVLRVGFREATENLNMTEFAVENSLKRLGNVTYCKGCRHRIRVDLSSSDIIDLIEANKINKECIEKGYTDKENLDELSASLMLGKYYINKVLKDMGIETYEDCPDSLTQGIIREYLEGEKITAIADRYNMTRNAIRYRLVNNSKHYREDNASGYVYVIKRGIATGSSLKDIAKQLNILDTTVVKFMLESGDKELASRAEKFIG